MSEGEMIRVPFGVRDVMPDWAEPTILGAPQGARRQYRYGNLHIREYDDGYEVHVDTVDPRRDKLGHLIHDAPEVLVGAGCGLAAGALAYGALAGSGGRRAKMNRGRALAAASAVAFGVGSISYEAARRIRQNASDGRSGNGSRSETRQKPRRPHPR